MHKRPRDSLSSVPAPPSNVPGKRVKFAAESDTPTAGGEDDLDLDLDGGGGGKKKTVVTEGYDSDSSAGSDDEFGGGGGRKAKAKGGEEEEEEEDMFGDKEPVEKVKGKGKDKDKEFMEMGDIEGQEFGREEGGAVEDDEDEEEDYELDDDLANNDDAPRSRRSKKSMGYVLSSFNMEEELAEGRFSTDGSYVPNSNDPLSTHDTWLDGVSKSAIKAARLSKKKMEDEAKKRDEQESGRGDEQRAQDRDDCLLGILGIVRDGETVAGALARLGAKKRALVEANGGAGSRKSKKTAASDAMDLDDDSTQPPPPSTTTEVDPITKKINLLTHFASTLLSIHGELEIYDQQHSDIVKTLRSEGAVRRDWIPPIDPDIEFERLAKEEIASAKLLEGRNGNRVRAVINRPAAPAPAPLTEGKWWYKWNLTPEGQPQDKEYGPYGRGELESWVAQGYFGAEGDGVSVRKDGVAGTRWVSWREARL